MNKVLGNKKAISLFVVPALIIYTIIVMEIGRAHV